MRRLLLLLPLTLFFLLPPTSLLAGQINPVAGTHFDPIHPPVHRPGTKPEVVEVFNFKCPHCFSLHPKMMAWVARNKEQFVYMALPMYWGDQTDAPLRAFYAAEFLGKGEVMKDAIFKAHFEQSVNIESADELVFLAEEVGLDPEKFRNYLNSFGVAAKIAQGKSLQRAFGVTSTPTIVVHGKFSVSPGKHANNDFDRALEIVEALATK